jgi:hypothetical protein
MPANAGGVQPSPSTVAVRPGRDAPGDEVALYNGFVWKFALRAAAKNRRGDTENADKAMLYASGHEAIL